MLTIDVIEACKQNDRKAQMQLYQNYCDGMYTVASRFLKNSMEAEDAVQDAFIKAFKKLDQFKGEVTFGAWLKRIVVNTCIDAVKAKKQLITELDEVHLKVIDDTHNDEWFVHDTIEIDEVKMAIERLPKKYRLVVKLYLVEGYDHQEISQILNISEVASRTQLSRGKAKLKEQLKVKENGTRS